VQLLIGRPRGTTDCQARVSAWPQNVRRLQPPLIPDAPRLQFVNLGPASVPLELRSGRTALALFSARNHLMPRVFRQAYTQPISYKGKPAVKFKARDDRTVIAPICEDDPTRCRRLSPYYSGRIPGNPDPVKIVGPDGGGVKDKTAAEILLGEMIRKAAMKQ